MKKTFIYSVFALLFALIAISCDDHADHDNLNDHDHAEDQNAEAGEEAHSNEVHLTQAQFDIMKMRVDSLPLRKMSDYVETNGELEVPPQNEASVTTIIGANINSIKVIEGDKVKKGQTLATISHPNLIVLQTDYISKFHELDYLQQDYERQSRLFEENVGSGKEFQKIKAQYLSTKGMVSGLEAQLKQMGMNPSRLQKGDIYEEVSVISPIDGNVRLVNVKTGQYVQPETELFELVNIDHIHADFMVFEKDINKIKEGQEIRFKIESAPDKELRAEIYSIGKAFEENPKAVHIHAEIDGQKGNLLLGMYVRGRIYTDETKTTALPDDAVVREGETFFVFTASRHNDDGEWHFAPIEVVVGKSDDGWKEIKFMNPLPQGTNFAWNNAYYLYSEMKKGEAEHVH
ncbi:efflux RND transporter periplasmic adaptor subunit [Cryomorpha ignava]|uniref:Efflux RND transporter periplasmic adaptor subunit n=1 Tax=Cryomorpha ignava TaxID=101383 RepID=A0A7K3WLU8_9FLAO|nr:efflux RND transporter periplasmic adaptor subunit [Cryomorpha ignava]NEN22619.1 efflux RND transporter periplasmic adaptor subunit [Cryomorpha ignava]